MKKKRIEIAAGIIVNQEGLIFITRRQKSSHLAGLWEFPGGKVETVNEEGPEQALNRELWEEVGIEALRAEPLRTLEYDYPDRSLTLHFFIVDRWKGQPESCEGQESRWLPASELIADEFPEANRPVIEDIRRRYFAA